MASFESLFPPESYGASPVVILDGGMGTTLQSPPFDLALDSALWSSELLDSEQGRGTLTTLHDAWLQAGAEIVETCTYQSSLPLFLPPPPSPPSSSYTPAQITSARQIMVSALSLACASCSSSSSLSSSSSSSTTSSTSSSRRQPLAALSLGPFGSSLQPGAEYSGLYPSPFRPSSASYETPCTPACSGAARGAVPLPLEMVRAPEGVEQDEGEVHLAAWHLQRLMDFSTSPAFDGEGGISLLAFETVPLLLEARAIRRAVSVFNALPSRSHLPPKAFFISFVFPRVNEGTDEEAVRFPDPTGEMKGLGVKEQAFGVVSAALQDEEGLAMPGGIGINCTSPLHLSTVVSSLSTALSLLPPSPSASSTKPYLLLYPDGGAIYDVHSRTWHHPLGLTADKWATLVADSVKEAREAGVWGGVVAGGCCKAGPREIEALREEVERRGWR